MKSKLFGIGTLVFVAVAGWKIGEALDPQALGMALGVIFGAMAGVPAALIALTASRQQRIEHIHRYEFPEAPQKPTAAISAHLPQIAQIAPPTVRVVESDVVVLPSKAQKRIEVNR